MQRFAVTVTCALAILWTPLAAFGQTTASTSSQTGSGNSQPQTDIADLPVCGQVASSQKSSTARSSSTVKPGSSRAGSQTADKPASRQAARRKRAAARRARSRGAATQKQPPGSSTQEPTQATLTLDQEDQETVTAAAFGRATEPQPLTLVYRISGCRVTDALSLPRTPLPTGPVKTADARPLPLGSVRIDDVDADGDRYVVHLLVFVSSDKAAKQSGGPVPSNIATATPSGSADTGSHSSITSTPESPTHPDGANATSPTATTAKNGERRTDSTGTAKRVQFTVAPGSYTSFVRLKAPWLRTVATPVTVTRSEDNAMIPIGIGILGGLAGFLLFWLLRKIHGDDLLVKETWVLWLTAGICVAVGAGTAFFTNYLNQEIWTFNANGLALFTASFSASTAGVTAGLLTGIYKTKATANPAAPLGGGGVKPAAGGGGKVD